MVILKQMDFERARLKVTLMVKPKQMDFVMARWINWLMEILKAKLKVKQMGSR